MRKYIIGIAAGVLLTSAAVVLAGSLDSPGAPGATNSYTLEHIYDRLYSGAAGTQITFTEPSSGPTVGTMHTLNEIMDKAPAVDATNGATETQVLTGTTVWGLTSGQWGVITGTMSNNGAVTIVPTTTQQTIATGYHNGSGYVEGDADLAAGNIVSDTVIFGVTGTAAIATYAAAVPRTGDSYTDGSVTGEDGELLKGVSWPNPRFTKSNGTVTDNLTGLIWLEDANCFSTSTWAQALTDANTLNSEECNLTDGSVEGDWRLPNVNELLSLIHWGVHYPAVPNTAGTEQWTADTPFDNVQSSYYWSSTSFAYDTLLAWYVYLGDGMVYSDDKVNAHYVWPVRGGQ